MWYTCYPEPAQGQWLRSMKYGNYSEFDKIKKKMVKKQINFEFPRFYGSKLIELITLSYNSKNK